MSPAEVMRVPKTPKAPSPVAVVDPTEPSPIPDPPIMTARLTTLTHQLGQQFGAVKRALRPIQKDLPAEIDRLRGLFIRQSASWEARQLTKAADRAIADIAAFCATLRITQALIGECTPLIQRAEEHVQHRRATATVAADIDGLELYLPKLRQTRQAWGELSRLYVEAETWDAIARSGGVRLFRATVAVALEYVCLTKAALLERERATVETIRETPSPIHEDIDTLQVTVELLGGTGTIPLPRITWPASADPFSPPELSNP